MRQYPTIGALRGALDAARKHCQRPEDKPGLLLDEDDILPLVEAVEKREAYIRRVKAASKTTRDVTALIKAIEEKV